MVIRHIALSLGRAILDRLSPDKAQDVTAAHLLQLTLSLGRAILQTITSQCRTMFLGHLSPVEAAEGEAALLLLSNGWPGNDRDLSKYPDLSALRATISTFIGELASNDPERQRAALKNKQLRKLLATETLRKEKLSKLLYFRDFNAVTDLDLRTAMQISASDRKRYDWNVTHESLGEAIREELFSEVENSGVRLAVARFCCQLVSTVSIILLRYPPGAITDETLKTRLTEAYKGIASGLSEENFQQSLKHMELAAQFNKPERFMSYVGLLREPGFQQALAEARRLGAEARQIASTPEWIRRVEEKILISP
ncbi:hypothetical protein [Bradyrhizobium sp. LA7.1]|uniref:hypothetical protein n=1 Tax=Bradyrhizobium sp. LA7.1 TaxID=3156324 RepID=UPI0033941BCB